MDSLRRKPSPPTHPIIPPAAPPLRPSFPSPSPPPNAEVTFTPRTSTAVTLQKQKRISQKALWAFTGVLLIILLLFSTLLWKGFSTVQKIQIEGNAEKAPTLAEKIRVLQAAFLPGEQVPLRGEERGRINVLLLGKAGEDLPGSNLTDTIMLVSIDTKAKKVALLSLPRDLYVPRTESGTGGKINSLYQQGLNQGRPLEPIKEAVTLVTGESVDYFFIMDFSGFEQVVDALGGITVEVPKDFYDPRYPGKNYSYEVFELKKGWQKLDGSTALKYVRERHDDPEGDFGRAKRQQQVLQAIKDRAYQPSTYLNFFRINKLFESVADNVETDVTLAEMQSFYELSKTLDTQNVTNQVIDAWRPESLLRVDHHTLGGTRAFTLVPRTGTWQETRELSQNIFALDALTAKKEALKNEQARVLILDGGTTLPSADKLARYIERELDMEARTLYTPQLEQHSYPAMLIARGNLTKPFSFEELLKRLPLEKGDTLPNLPLDIQDTDFVIIMDNHLAESFENADQYYNANEPSPEEEAPGSQ